MCDLQNEMPTLPRQLLDFLTQLGIKYENTSHPAVFTADEAEKYWKDIEGMHCKNLFCKDAAGVLWLIVVPAFKRVNLKALPALIGSKRLSFAKEELLFETLGVHGGSVTPFSIINDKENRVNVVLDREMMDQDKINFHPLTNTATTTITPADLLHFMQACHHIPKIVQVCSME